ncbi:dienelactone hydrolase family protein [Caulobacter radicis]|nr:dienelactone hydrolase family protein [Caulobacter radicis]
MQKPLTLLACLLLGACATTPARGPAPDRAAAPAPRLAVETRSYATTPLTPTPSDLPPVEAFADASFTAPNGVRLPYRLLSPATKEKLPLVVMLHGSGAVGHDNKAQMGPFVRSWARPGTAKAFPAFVLAPQAPVRTANYAKGADRLLASRPGTSLPAILALIDELSARLPIDTDRIYLVGFSMGGSAAMNAAALEPGKFAAVAAFSGVPPERALAVKVAPTPVMIVHGDKDRENPYAPDLAWAGALADAGGDVRFVSYSGMAHVVPPDMMHDDAWRAWLFSQKRKKG